MHGMRFGLPIENPPDSADSEGAGICDWWGTPENRLERKDVRYSVVVSFRSHRDHFFENFPY